MTEIKNQKTQDCVDAIRDTTNEVIKIENELRDIRKELMEIADLFYPVLQEKEKKNNDKPL